MRTTSLPIDFWIALYTMTGMLIGLLMMIGTTFYLNKSSKRFRIFELAYSKNSEWYKTGKINFFPANFLIPLAVVAALKMHNNWIGSENARKNGFELAPFIHFDNNYNKLISEFALFVKWELAKLAVSVFTFLPASIWLAIGKSWG